MMIWFYCHKTENQIIIMADNDNPLVHVVTKVKLPYHVVKATLLNPPRQEVRVPMWNIGDNVWFEGSERREEVGRESTLQEQHDHWP